MPTIFEGENGGTTSMGVSGTEIRIAITVPPGVGTSASYKALRTVVDALFEHVNRSFELFGRRLVPVYVEGDLQDAITNRALAVSTAAQEPFAALTGFYEDWSFLQPALAQELARNGVVTVMRSAGIGWPDRVLFDAEHPYVWSVFSSVETNLAHLGDFACRAMAGRLASHAIDPSLREKTRRFGVISAGRQSPPAVGVLMQALQGCDQDAVKFDWVQIGYDYTALDAGLNRLKAAGVTTVVCACERWLAFSTMMTESNVLGFQPEWLVPPAAVSDDQACPRDKPTACIVLSSGPKLLPLQARPWFGALMETNPALLTTTTENLNAAFQMGQILYDGLLVLASGIQGAGPQLTPETFAAALMSTQFPNPGAGQAPYWQPSAGFGPGDHSFYDDYNVAWWSPTAPAIGPSTNQGSWCYVGQGARFQLGSYTPSIDGLLFDDSVPCR